MKRWMLVRVFTLLTMLALQVVDRYVNSIINNNDMVREDVLRPFGVLLSK